MAAFRIPPSDYAADRAKLFARAPSKIYFGHIASAAVLIYLASDVLPVYVLVAWAMWEFFVTPILLHRLGKQVGPSQSADFDLTAWQNKLHGLFALVGVSWGLFIAAGLDINNPAHFSIQMAIVAGASASAARSLGIFRYSFYFYEIPFAGLLSARIFMLGGDYILLAVLVLIFMGMLCRLANDTSEELSDYLATKVENLDLAQKYQRAAQRANDANLAKTQFLSQANHDLRQPIHAISLLTECLRDQPLDREGGQILDTIDASVDNLAKLFKSLLNISSLESGTLKVEVSAFALDAVIQQVVRQAQPEAMQHGTKLVFVPTSLWVKTDRALMISILQNLVFNAVNYARGEKALIGARRQNGRISIHVLDQGIGIPAADQSRIFTEFERLNPNGPGRVEGLGIGLTIVARTASILGLEVDLNSVEGQGTHVTLRDIERVNTPSNPVSTPPKTSNMANQNQSILVIDDNPQILIGLQLLLSKWGYAVIAFAPDAMTLPAKAPDLLVIDLHLNIEKDGLEMAAEIATHYGQRIPTMVVSATLTPDIKAEIDDKGHWSMLKPVSPHKLRSTLLAMTTKRP